MNLLRNFRLQIIIRILLLSLTLMLFMYLVLGTQLYATILIISLLCLLQVALLIRYVDKTNQDLTRFFDAIRHADFSQSFSVRGQGKSIDALRNVLTEIIEAFQKTRADKEEHYRYLQTVIQHVGIGLLAFQKDGRIELMNTAAKRLLKIRQLKNLSALRSTNAELVDHLLQMKAGHKILLKLSDQDEIQQLSVYATEFRLKNKSIILVSIQNIQSELEEKEMDAWQNLIRVLTHEIMNSITPISSLAGTVDQLLENDHECTHLESFADIRTAVNTIRKRSEGLLHFVNTYRSLTRIPKPDFRIISIQDLFEQIIKLMEGRILEQGIIITSQIEPASLELTADPKLIEQVLINLLLNAAEALRGNEGGRIKLAAWLNEEGKVMLEVSDNGPGILQDVQEKIFIPFFTTKKEGSGIGLSLCRQIMRLHKGTITVQSGPETGTTFRMRF